MPQVPLANKSGWLSIRAFLCEVDRELNFSGDAIIPYPRMTLRIEHIQVDSFIYEAEYILIGILTNPKLKEPSTVIS
ncbi:hypothetical protein LZF95_02820 [Algoriphagus sp. AGSA1]|uniref:hypothetical protein n=1 Tax=Algoriphagus sp. AGSA1 TaxID=2907213 RepID=UPI001F433AED|nr:hypothetical protein [Algoriphagus sp. AGSA1]MCE7053595.1 hypothetical protein [Algoriphagus sp. AGSA1]